MTIGTIDRSFPVRLDGFENTNPYYFIEDVIAGYLKTPIEQSQEDKVETYKELTAAFLIISRHAADMLSFFKTHAGFDGTLGMFHDKIIDLEAIFTSTSALFSRFHSLAMLNLTGSKQDIGVSSGYWMSCLTSVATLRQHVQELLVIQCDIKEQGVAAEKQPYDRVYHPSSLTVDREGFVVYH